MEADLEDDVVNNVFQFADDRKLFRRVRDTVDTVGMLEDLEGYLSGLINGRCSLM